MDNIPEGYKQTEVGVIPQGWEVKKICDVAEVVGGGTPSTFTQKYWNGNINWFTPTEIGFNKYSYESLRKITEEGLKDSSAKLLPIGTILLTSRASIGDVSILKVPASTNQGFQSLIANENIDNEFLYYLISTLKNTLIKYASGSTFLEISPNKLKNIVVTLPPNRVEQTAIASALSDVDALIIALEQLITKKRNVKQGAMQQLLTGKKRLPGFSGEWEMVPLKNLIQVPVTDGPHLTPKFLQDGIPFLSVNNLVNNRISLSNLRYISKNDHDIFSRKCKPQKEDILLGKAASVGLVAVVDLDFDFNIWSPIALIRLRNQHIPKFIYYSFQSRYVINQIKLLTNSSSQGNIGMGDIEEIDFLVPSKEEQTAIAQILSDMDTEIEALEQKQDKYRALKQGMMQELLTGKTRLV